MTFNNSLIPWKWSKKSLPIRKEESTTEYPTVFSLQQDINRIVEKFFRSFESESLSSFGLGSTGESSSLLHPPIDVSESEKELRVSVELPGLDDKDLDLSISDDCLIIRGEKQEEHEENTSGYYRMERHYGSFQRTIPFPCGVDKDQAKAVFKRGVLTVVLPKDRHAQKEVRKIPINKE